MLRAIAIICCLLAGEARAGAWLREEGTAFLSFGTEVAASDGDIFTSAYAEYGLREKLTLGLDLGMSEDALYKGVVFARVPLTRPDRQIRLAAELGLGVREDEPVLRPGLMVGRGFELGGRSGWMALDVLSYWETGGGDWDVSTDLTVGVNMTRRSKLILQLQCGNHPMDPEYLKFAPSFVLETKPGQHIELGVLAGVENADDLALKLGLWRSF